MKKELQMLRSRMEKKKIDAYLIMTDDFHGSEYVGDFFKSREYISGFTGSAGTLLVLQNFAGLWTDGRYYLQAEKQLSGSGITLFRSGQRGVPTVEEFLITHMKAGQTLGFDGRCVMAHDAEKLRKKLGKCQISVCSAMDLVGEIWVDRPEISKKPVWILPEEYAGSSRREKLEQVRKRMKEKQADWFLLASLEDICWLLNIRGNDVECTPVVLSYLLMGQKEAFWYVHREAVSEEIRNILQKDGIFCKDYAQIFADVSTLCGKTSILYDRYHINDALVSQIPETVQQIDAENPTLFLKAVKNPVEVKNERIAHIRDGVAVTKFIYWLKKQVGKEKITEISAARYLETLRRKQEHYVGPSFHPILAYREHGAIVHYTADEISDSLLKPESFLLADTGGHYLEGTTDITRTIAMGPLTREEKEMYTTVLQCHIHLSDARFLKGCTGMSLDGLARMPLWKKGLDYNHGTGHGVGYLLSVHEGPNSFRYRPAAARGNDCVFEEGMITSDEPGIYLEGKFGIRLENLLVCEKEEENAYGSFLRFVPLTLVPFEMDAVLWEQCTEREILWLKGYHETVYRTLSPYLEKEEREWLKEIVEAIPI